MSLEKMELLRLGDLARYINGRGFKPAEFVSKGLPIIRIANLNNSDAPFDYFDGDLDDGHLIHKGDILVSWSASLETYIWDKDLAALNQHIFKVVPKPELIDHEFLFFVLKYAMKGLREMVHGATMKHVTRPEFESYEVSIPINKETQRKIAENLKTQITEVGIARKALEIQFQDISYLVSKLKNQLFLKLEDAERVPLGDLLIGIEAGKSFQTLETLAQEDEIGVIKSYRPRKAGGLTVVSSPKGCQG